MLLAKSKKLFSNLNMYAKFILQTDQESDVLGGELKSLAQIDDGIRKLDGDRFCVLIIAEGPATSEQSAMWSGKCLDVSGGENDLYYCEIYDQSNDVYLVPFNKFTRDADVAVQIKRGELTEVRQGSLLDIDEAIKTAEAFAQTGEAWSGIEWHQQ